MIESYSFGKIVVDGKALNHDIIIHKGEIRKWWRHESHDIKLDEIDEIIQDKPKVLVIGNGASGVMDVRDEIITAIRQKGVKVIVQNTGEAVKTYNELSRKQNVTGAFHLTC